MLNYKKAQTASKEQFKSLTSLTKEEFEESHIEDAINIDIYSPSFEGAITDLDKTKSYLVYCTSGGRSLQATMFMRKNGFANVENLGGGISSLE
jgi:rhodanese-related sulfurtransferase